MYRHDRIAFLKKEIEEAKMESFHYGVKLVRGAYMEKERERAQLKNYASPIQPNKTACDKDFNEALEIIISEIENTALCAGSHNEKSALALVDLMEKFGIPKNDKRIYFAQLLGMSDHISYNLSNEGFNVAKYVPYGPVKEVIPYLLRRANENTSVAGQTSRELGLIIKEKERRATRK
jgi:proline dehydrogenase